MKKRHQRLPCDNACIYNQLSRAGIYYMGHLLAIPSGALLAICSHRAASLYVHLWFDSAVNQ